MSLNGAKVSGTSQVTSDYAINVGLNNSVTGNYDLGIGRELTIGPNNSVIGIGQYFSHNVVNSIGMGFGSVKFVLNATGLHVGGATAATVPFQVTGAVLMSSTLGVSGLLTSQNIVPSADDTYYLGEIGSPFKAYKALVLKDTTDGKHYSITVVNGTVTATALD